MTVANEAVIRMRKPKLTYEVVDKACEMKRHGATNIDVCRALGFSDTAWYRWIKDPDTRVKRALVDGLKKAEAEYKESLLARIEGASEKPQHWTAAAWLLERKYPEEYGRPETRKADDGSADDVPRIELGVEVRVVGGDGNGDSDDPADAGETTGGGDAE